MPFELGTAAIQRVLKDRALDATHPYKPTSLPCVVQFSKDHGKYRFQRLGDPENGHLREGSRVESIGKWLQRDAIPVAAERFRHIKSEWRFANDPTDPLYLAMHLWLVEFAEISADAERVGRYWKLEVSVGALTRRLRGKYGRADAKEVVAALQLLKSAQLADHVDKDRWTVAWGEVARKNDEDSLLDTLADRACRNPRSGPITSIHSDEVIRAKRATQARLFE